MSIQSLYRMHKGMLTFQQRFVEDLAATTIQKLYRAVLGLSLSLSLSQCMPPSVLPFLPSRLVAGWLASALPPASVCRSVQLSRLPG